MFIVGGFPSVAKLRRSEMSNISLLRSLEHSECCGSYKHFVPPGLFKLLLILMSHGVSPNHQWVMNGWTPIMDAIMEGHKEVFDILLAYGADLRIRNDNRENTFDVARRFNRESWVEPYRSRTDKTLKMW